MGERLTPIPVTAWRAPLLADGRLAPLEACEMHTMLLLTREDAIGPVVPTRHNWRVLEEIAEFLAWNSYGWLAQGENRPAAVLLGGWEFEPRPHRHGPRVALDLRWLTSECLVWRLEE